MFNIWSLIQEASWDLCWNTFSGSQTITGHTRHSLTHQLGLKRRLQQTGAPSIQASPSQTYILIYLYVVKADTGGSLGKSIIYSNPQPCAACDLSGSLLSQ